MERREAGKPARAHAGTLGLEVPQRAVECISRGSCRQQRLKLGPRESLGKSARTALYRGHHTHDRLAIAGIWYALAASAKASISDRSDHDDRLGLRAAGNGESPRYWKALDAHAKLQPVPH